MQEENVQSQEPKSIGKKLLTSWMFWVTLISLIFAVFDKIFYYHTGMTLFIALYGGPFMLTLFFAFLAAAVISMVKLILQLVRRSKASTFNWLPLIILVFQACVVTFANVVPIPDYYRIHAKELNQLVQYVEGQGIKVPEERAITVKIPKQFKEFASREVVASKENGVLKIRVKLTGTHFGNHSFLLYRANGSDPTQKDFLNTKEQKSTFVRKSGKWFLVKWND